MSRENRIRNYNTGTPFNTADGLNAVVQEYEYTTFVKTIAKYLLDDTDRHEYLTQRRGKRTTQYCTTIMSFDIETSSLYVKDEKRVVPYIWQIAIQNYVFYGRHFADIVEMFNTLAEIFETDISRRIVIWVHNLPYEFQFIRKYFEWNDVFSLSERNVIKATTTNGIEFRCSLILSGMSLNDVANKGIKPGKVKKMVGDLDYSLVRHEKTPLTDEELRYCINDVLVVVEYITEQVNELYGDITKLPMTKTGAVRQEVRNATIRNPNKKKAFEYMDIIRKLTLEPMEYYALTQAFAGGFTHANPNYVEMILENVGSADIASAYPAVICSEKFPMGKGQNIIINNDYDKFNRLAETGLMVFKAGFKNIRAKHKFEHTLQYAKCFGKRRTKVDNNRVVSADALMTYMTSVDLEMLNEFYEYEHIAIADVWYYEKDYLPRELVLAVLDLYNKKTILKDTDELLLYNLKKSNLNSVYGMMVMSIIRELIEYSGRDENPYNVTTIRELSPEYDKAIDEYNKSRSRFLYYPWGVFVTAYARQRLQNFILMTREDHVYSDTDSDKFLNPDKHIKDIESFNKAIDIKNRQAAKELKIDLELYYPKTIKGVVKPIGYLELEETYNRFKTLGAKRYLVEVPDYKKGGSKIKLTCAGVNKEKGAEYIASKEEPFEFFRNYMHIPKDKSGKMNGTYIDKETEFDCVDYNGVKDHCIVKSGLHLESSPFTLSMDVTFLSFLNSIEERKHLWRV